MNLFYGISKLLSSPMPKGIKGHLDINSRDSNVISILILENDMYDVLIFHPIVFKPFRFFRDITFDFLSGLKAKAKKNGIMVRIDSRHVRVGVEGKPFYPFLRS